MLFKNSVSRMCVFRFSSFPAPVSVLVFTLEISARASAESCCPWFPAEDRPAHLLLDAGLEPTRVPAGPAGPPSVPCRPRTPGSRAQLSPQRPAAPRPLAPPLCGLDPRAGGLPVYTRWAPRVLPEPRCW